MKIGIISDVHNNVFALNSMLQLFEEKGCDEIICCGDIIGIGPFPEETVQKLKSLKNFHCVLGNHEQYLINGIKRPYPAGMSEEEGLYHEWEHGLLSDDSKSFITQLPHKLFLKREEIKLAAVHYALNKENRYISILQNPALSDCEKMFSDLEADIILYGHDHKGSVFYGRGKTFINCGALGCTSTCEGIARGGMLSIKNQKFTFEKVFAEYDLQQVIREIDSIRFPAYEEIKKIFFGVK